MKRADSPIWGWVGFALVGMGRYGGGGSCAMADGTVGSVSRGRRGTGGPPGLQGGGFQAICLPPAFFKKTRNPNTHMTPQSGYASPRLDNLLKRAFQKRDASEGFMGGR
jgi:hypothetical protein